MSLAPRASSCDVSVVIPCFNEEPVIERSVHRVLAALEQLKCRASHDAITYEVIVADDGSTDQSLELLRRLAARHPPVQVVANSPNRGMGHASRSMYAVTRGHVVVQMDADLAMDPSETLPAFLEALETADCVLASRFGGVRATYPLHRRAASVVYRLTRSVLLGLPPLDTQSGFFGIKGDVLRALPLEADGFEIHAEMVTLLLRGGESVTEVPIEFVHSTESGEVSVLRAGPRMLIETIRIRRRLGHRRSNQPR